MAERNLLITRSFTGYSYLGLPNGTPSKRGVWVRVRVRVKVRVKVRGGFGLRAP